ncbi:hypothetical protein [Streptomyces avicenniae]|uniref:hypothetical protein n=1 Tax=Streptomyces avicenniae TaxID=500153 RepID=UPI00069CB0A3|nr:hypothetical protein [Streptomyces avicenniae]
MRNGWCWPEFGQHETANRIREEFHSLLATDAGRGAQLIVAAELLQSASRDDHTTLVPPHRELITRTRT